MSLPSSDELHRLFTFDFEQCKIYWNRRPLSDFPTAGAGKAWNTKYAGQEAFISLNEGYLYGKIQGKGFRKHRVLWAAYYGQDIPDGGVIDHINGDPSDNSIENLRCVSPVGNRRNMKKHARGSAMFTGVKRENNRWLAHIQKSGAQHRIGLFDTVEEARNARRQAEIELGYHPNHGLTADERAAGGRDLAEELALVELWRRETGEFALTDDSLSAAVRFSRFLIASGLARTPHQ